MGPLKLKYDDLQNVMKYLEKNAPGQDITVMQDNINTGLILELQNSNAEKTVIKIPAGNLDRFVTIMEEKWLHKIT